MIFVSLGNAYYPCILLLEFEIHWGYIQKETSHVAEYWGTSKHTVYTYSQLC